MNILDTSEILVDQMDTNLNIKHNFYFLFFEFNNV